MLQNRPTTKLPFVASNDALISELEPPSFHATALDDHRQLLDSVGACH